MSETCDSMMASLNEALAFARGEKTGAIVHQIEMPSVDAARIRANTDRRSGKAPSQPSSS